MGSKQSKTPSKRHNANRVFASNEPIQQTHNHHNSQNLDSVNELEEIKVPDKTSKHKSKSYSMFAPFTKKTSIRKTSSLQSAVQGQKVPENSLQKLRRENEELTQAIHKMEERNEEDKKHYGSELMQLKTEVKALNSALRKARSDKDKALRTEKDAVERANNFEQEKEKTQRNFKLFREAKEEEVGTLLKEKQALQNQLIKLVNNEGSINEILMESGDFRHAKLINEWLLGQPGQSGTESCVGQQSDEKKWISSQNKRTKEVCKAFKSVLNSVQRAGHGVPIGNVYSLYVTSPKHMKPTAEHFIAECKRLQLQLEPEGRLLNLSYFISLLSMNLDKTEIETRNDALSKTDIVMVIIDQESADLDASADIIWKALQLNKKCFVASLQEVTTESLQFLTNGLHNHPKLGLLHGNNDEEQLVSECYEQLATTCKMFHDKQLDREQFSCFSDKGAVKVTEDVFRSWDMLGIEEQASLQANFKSNTLPSDTFVKEMEELNHYITQDGPVMPMLVKGVAGCGKSTLLSNWIASIEDSLPNSCILYHVADLQSPYSLDPVHILRRFLIILLDQLPMILGLKEVEKEFPSWLDRACCKYKNGVVIIIDGIDHIADYREYFKWLIDPMPVPVRVIISVSGGGSHPKQWKDWNTLELQCDIESTLRVCQYQLETVETQLTPKSKDFLQRMLQDRQSVESLSVHLYRHLVFTLMSWTMSDGEADRIIPHLSTPKHITELYILILEVLVLRHDKALVQSLLSLVYLSFNGLSLGELEELHDNDYGLLPLVYDLVESEVVHNVGGIIKITHSVGIEAIKAYFQISRDSNDARVTALRSNLVALFENKLSLNCISYRVADELPAQLVELSDTEKLYACMSSIFVFVHLYRRGRFSTIVNYWKILGKDLTGVQQVYTAALEQIQQESDEFDGQITMLYDIVGSFFKDLGHYSISQSFLEKSLELKEEHLEPDDILLRRSHFLLAKLFTQWKKFLSAEDCLKQALEVKNISNDSEPTVATILDFFAGLCMLQEKPKDADMYRKKAASMRESIFVQHDLLNVKNNLMECSQLVSIIYDTRSRDNINVEEITSWLVNISYVYFNVKQYPEAAEALQQALKYLTHDTENTNYQTVADVMYKLSFVYTTLGQNDKAEGMLESALNTYFKLNLLEEPNLMVVINSLVKLYKSQKRMDSLERLHRQHCEAMEKAYGPSDIRVASVINDLAVHLSRMGKLDEAFKLYKRAMNIYVKVVGFQDERVSEVLANLAVLMYGEKNTELATHYYKLSREPNRVIDQLNSKFVSTEVR